MSLVSTASPNTPRRALAFLSIRARLIVLALLAVTPLTIERMHGLENARTERTEHAFAVVTELAHRGAESQRGIIYSTRGLLQVFARMYAKRPLDTASCNEALAALDKNIEWLRGINLAAADGRVICATDPRGIGLNIADRRYFRDALHSRDFALSDYLISRVHQVPGLIATYPITQDNGSIAGVVFASINLQWVGKIAAAAAEHPGASVVLIDGSGTLIAASADEANLVGKNFAADALVRDMLTTEEGTTTIAGLDGIPRIFAFVGVPWTKARLAVGLDEKAVHSGIDREITIAYWQLVLFGMLVLLTAWFGGEQLVVRPIRSLARTAARFGRGDLHARASEEPWLAEFAPLAAALDDMAAKLAAREEELQIANQHLDELASLDGLTGLANRRGFDRELERAWRGACEKGAPIALMMIDIDHFKLFNDRYGHVAGDACLRSVSETLSLVTLDTAPLVARFGGEEFAVLMPGVDSDGCAALAEEARRAVEDLLIVHAEASRGLVTVSVGIASLVPAAEQPAADLIEAADRALYAAKRRGRNTVIAHSPFVLSVAS